MTAFALTWHLYQAMLYPAEMGCRRLWLAMFPGHKGEHHLRWQTALLALYYGPLRTLGLISEKRPMCQKYRRISIASVEGVLDEQAARLGWMGVVTLPSSVLPKVVSRGTFQERRTLCYC